MAKEKVEELLRNCYLCGEALLSNEKFIEIKNSKVSKGISLGHKDWTFCQKAINRKPFGKSLRKADPVLATTSMDWN